jgi:hypothetical protein
MSETPNETPPVDNNVPTPSQSDLDAFHAWQASNASSNAPADDGDDDTTWIVGHDGQRVKTDDYDFVRPYDPTKDAK